MDAPCANVKVIQGEKHEALEDEFKQMVHRIGGKEKIYLVGETCKNDDQRSSLLALSDEMFNTNSYHRSKSVIATLSDNLCPDAENHNDATTNDVAEKRDVQLTTSEDKCMNVGGHESVHNGSRVIRTSRNASETTRVIDSALIIFIFRHEYMSNNCNHTCIKEIMRDIKARTKHSPTFPAVIGLVHSTDENRGSIQSVQVLKRLLYTVFWKHCTDSIWAGLFIPNTVEKMMDIKRHVNRAVHSSLSSDNVRTSNSLWSLKCLSWWRQQRRSRGQPSSMSRSMEIVEGIPLKSKPAARGQQGDFANGIS